MVITSATLAEFRNHQEFLLNVKKISGDRDVTMEHIIAAMIENGAIKKDYFDVEYPGLRDGLELPRMRDFGYIEKNNCIPLQRFLGILREMSPTHAIYAFLCCNLYFAASKLLELATDSSFSVLFDSKLPKWLVRILDEQKQNQLDAGNKNLFIPFGMNSNQFLNAVRYTKNSIMQRYGIAFEEYKKFFYQTPVSIRRKEIKMFENGQGCTINGKPAIIINTFGFYGYRVQFADKIRIAPFYVIKPGRKDKMIMEKMKEYGHFGTSKFHVDKGKLWKAIESQLRINSLET